MRIRPLAIAAHTTHTVMLLQQTNENRTLCKNSHAVRLFHAWRVKPYGIATAQASLNTHLIYNTEGLSLTTLQPHGEFMLVWGGVSVWYVYTKLKWGQGNSKFINKSNAAIQYTVKDMAIWEQPSIFTFKSWITYFLYSIFWQRTLLALMHCTLRSLVLFTVYFFVLSALTDCLSLIFRMDSMDVPDNFINVKINNKNFKLPYLTFLPRIL